MKYILFSFISLTISIANAQQINCDSLARQFDEAIATAKAQKLDAATLQQLEATKKQFLDLYCKANTPKSATETTSTKNTNSTTKISNTTTSAKYNMAYAIDLYVETNGVDGNVKSGYIYWLNAKGNEMLIDKEGIKKAIAFLPSIEEAPNNFDAWHIENTGKSIMYTTTEEGEKVALTQQLIKKLHVDKNHKLAIKPTNQTKKIAGYNCVSYTISGNADGENVNLTCWVTTAALPFYHNSFPMLSMFSTGAIGISGLPNRGVLLVQGKSGSDNILIEVRKIQPMLKTFTLAGYKNFTY